MRLFMVLMLFGLLALTACGGGPSFTGFYVTNGSFDLWIDVVMFVNNQGTSLGRLNPGEVITVGAEAGAAYTFVGRWEDGVDDQLTGTVPTGSTQQIIFLTLSNGNPPPPPPPPPPNQPAILPICNESDSGIYMIRMSVGSADKNDPPALPVWQEFYNGGGPNDPNRQIMPGAVADEVVEIGDGFYSVWIYFANGDVDYIPTVEMRNGVFASMLGDPPPVHAEHGVCLITFGPWSSSFGYPYYDPP